MRRKLHLHDLSAEKNFSGNMGKLIPTHTRLVYPNDHVRERATYFVRVSPLLAPIISKIMIKVESFYVPTDLVWVNAQEFYSAGQNGQSTKVIPKFNIEGVPVPNTGQGTLLDYLGFPVQVLTLNVNALMPRVYNAIYNWHYRDRDLQNERTISTADGPDTTTDITLASRCWERDRFTTARLEPQRGDDVFIPAASEPVVGDVTMTASTNAWRGYDASGNVPVPGGPALQLDVTTADLEGGSSTPPDIKFDPRGGLEASFDAEDAMGTIRELGEAVAIDRFRRRLQQSDGSYPDYTLATFGIRSPDIELQKPVLLARSSSPLQISEIIQTAANYDAEDEQIGDPVGDLKGHGIATFSGHGYRYKVKRHGYIMTIFSVVPKSMYDGGIDKEWFRSTHSEYFDPDIDQIGEEPILKKELSPYGEDVEEDFGWQYRNYCDRSSLNTVAGEMHNELDFWHQARKFELAPSLNSDFVTCNPTDRIFALGSTQDQLRVKAMHDVKILRVMPRIPKRGVL